MTDKLQIGHQQENPRAALQQRQNRMDQCVASQSLVAAYASIKPVQVSIEGLARHAEPVHAQQAGSVGFVLATCCSDLAVGML